MEMQLVFPSAYTLSCYLITSGNDAPDKRPQDRQLLGSNDGNNWVGLDSRNRQVFESKNQTKISKTGNTVAYTYYRWAVFATNGSVDFSGGRVESDGELNPAVGSIV